MIRFIGLMVLVDNGEILIDGADDLYDIVLNNVMQFDNCVIDLKGVKSMTTKFAANLFGRLYCTLGHYDYFKTIKIINTNEDLNLLIKLGIQRYIEVELWEN